MATVISLLGQGMAPKRIALSLACGITLGIFPILGISTILCFALAPLFRLNVTAAVAASWAVYPLQLVLIAPFFLAGGFVFGKGPFILAAPATGLLSTSGMIHTAGMITGSTLHAVFAWGMAAPIFMAVLYASLVPMLRKLSRVS